MSGDKHGAAAFQNGPVCFVKVDIAKIDLQLYSVSGDKNGAAHFQNGPICFVKMDIAKIDLQLYTTKWCNVDRIIPLCGVKVHVGKNLLSTPRHRAS